MLSGNTETKEWVHKLNAFTITNFFFIIYTVFTVSFTQNNIIFYSKQLLRRKPNEVQKERKYFKLVAIWKKKLTPIELGFVTECGKKLTKA